MTEKEFLEKLNNKDDTATLYTDIINGKVSFDLCKKIITTYNLYASLEAHILCHPDCPINFFISRYNKKVSPHTENETHVLSKSHCLRDLKAVATVLNISKSSIEDIVKCVEYPNSKRKIDIMVINNKYVNTELRNALYNVTKDINYISPIAKDIFLYFKFYKISEDKTYSIQKKLKHINQSEDAI